MFFKGRLVNKYCRLAPVVIFSALILILFRILEWYSLDIYTIIFQICFIADIGFGGGGFPFLWYINVMFIVLPFYLYLYHILGRCNFIFVTLLIVFLSYSAITGACGNHWYSKQYAENIISIFMLRALGGIGIGCLIGLFYITFNSPSKKNVYIYSIVEFFCITFMIYIINIKGIDGRSPIIFPLSFIFIFLVFIRNGGIFANIFNAKIFTQLSSYGYSMYVMSFPTFYLLNKFMYSSEYYNIHIYPYRSIVVSMITVFFVGVFTYYFIERPCFTIFKNIFSVHYNK